MGVSRAHVRKVLQIGLFLVALVVTACAGIEPYEPRDDRNEGPKQGLFSGSEGEFVIYRSAGERRTGKEEKKTIESASGADNKYTSPENISMVPASRTAAQSSLPPRERQSSYRHVSSRASSQPGPYASHGVYLGSYENATGANYGWTQTWSQHWKVLQGVQASIEYGTGSGGAAGYNLYGMGLTKDRAQGVCRNLLARQASCTVVNF